MRQKRSDGSGCTQATVHRVGVGTHAEGAVTTHPHIQAGVVVHPSRWQRLQQRLLCGQSLLATGVELFDDAVQKGGIRGLVVEIAMATQHQGLIHRLNETPVPLLDVAVFLRAVRMGLARLQAVVSQRGVVAVGEFLGVLQLVHRRTQAIGLMGAGHATQRSTAPAANRR